jgi:hypothetical protein
VAPEPCRATALESVPDILRTTASTSLASLLKQVERLLLQLAEWPSTASPPSWNGTNPSVPRRINPSSMHRLAKSLS